MPTIAHPRPLVLTSYAEPLATLPGDRQVSDALVRKSPADRVPLPVWWQVAAALRSGSADQPARAVAEVDDAVAALREAVPSLPEIAPVNVPGGREDSPHALQVAILLVARLLVATAPTSPTLLQVRLARLRRALAAAAG